MNIPHFVQPFMLIKYVQWGWTGKKMTGQYAPILSSQWQM